VSEIGQMKIDCTRFGYIEVGSAHMCTFEVLTSGTGHCCLLGCDAVSRRRSLVVVTSKVSKEPFGLAFCPDLEAAETLVASFQATWLFIPEDRSVGSTSR
jgi:hypothetical protein